MNGMNDRTCGKEQESLEKGVRHQVESPSIETGRMESHGGIVTIQPERHHHVAELTDRGVGEHAFDIVLHQGNRRRHERRNQTDDGYHQRCLSRPDKNSHGARHQVDTRCHHGRGVDQRRYRRGALHRVRQPYVQGELGRFADSAAEHKDGDKRDNAGGYHSGRDLVEDTAIVKRAGVDSYQEQSHQKA